MSITMEQWNILGSLINSTFGKSSISDAGHGVKASLAGHSGNLDSDDLKPILEIRFETLANYNPIEGIRNQKNDLDKQSLKMLNEKISQIKKEFREESGKILKTKEIKTPDSLVEHLSHNRSLVRVRYSRKIYYELYV